MACNDTEANEEQVVGNTEVDNVDGISPDGGSLQNSHDPLDTVHGNTLLEAAQTCQSKTDSSSQTPMLRTRQQRRPHSDIHSLSVLHLEACTPLSLVISVNARVLMSQLQDCRFTHAALWTTSIGCCTGEQALCGRRSHPINLCSASTP